MSPNQQLTVTLTLEAHHWNALMEYLANGPYRYVAQVISEIQRQCTAEQQQMPAVSGNGADMTAEQVQ